MVRQVSELVLLGELYLLACSQTFCVTKPAPDYGGRLFINEDGFDGVEIIRLAPNRLLLVMCMLAGWAAVLR